VRRACDGRGLLVAFRAAVANLEAHVEEVNALNVYPVPDGDTGSNMLATVRAALAEAERVEDRTLGRVAGAISFGALMGARGNSGVIASQIFRGMAEGVGDKRQFDGHDLADALSRGNHAAYRAVGKPVEGTILTVIREAADAARAAATGTVSAVETVAIATVGAAEAAVARTPSLLPILRDAGVVDAGGAGLVHLFAGALRQRKGSVVAGHPVGAVAGPAAAMDSVVDGFGYETMFLLQPRPAEVLDLESVRAAMTALGDSVLVAGDERAAKIHVHSARPDQVIAAGLGLGVLSRISVENLDAQARDVRETRATAFTGEPTTAGTDGAPGAGPDRPDVARGAGPDDADGARSEADPRPPLARPPTAIGAAPPYAVVAVVAGAGLVDVFRSLGNVRIVAGGQSANPSTGELIAAVNGVDAQHVLLLPNNPNVLLAARQVAALSGRTVTVIPTRNAAEGLAALLALDVTGAPDDNIEAMTAAARAIQTLQVATAVRDATFGGHPVHRGDVIVLDPDDGLVASGDDELRAILAGMDALTPGFELVTLYAGEAVGIPDARALAAAIRQHRPGIEVEVVPGGQPQYRYLLAAE
jgi:DAK2 domain fusion protein YloV